MKIYVDKIDGYPRFTKNNLLVHRAIIEKFYGKLPKGVSVHHIDGNKLNFAPNNLQVVTQREHSRIHSPRFKRIIGKWFKQCPDCSDWFEAGLIPRYYCKLCAKKHDAEYRSKNRERISKQRKKYYGRNRERFLNYARQRYRLVKK